MEGKNGWVKKREIEDYLRAKKSGRKDGKTGVTGGQGGEREERREVKKK